MCTEGNRNDNDNEFFNTFTSSRFRGFLRQNNRMARGFEHAKLWRQKW